MLTALLHVIIILLTCEALVMRQRLVLATAHNAPMAMLTMPNMAQTLGRSLLSNTLAVRIRVDIPVALRIVVLI